MAFEVFTRKALPLLHKVNIPLYLVLGSAGVSILLILASLYFPWYEVPYDQFPTASGEFETLSKGSPVTKVYKILVLLGCVTFAYLLYKYRSNHRPATIFLALALAVSLAYPAFLQFFSPRLAIESAWLYIQHYNLSWFGGEIYTSSEQRDFDWKQRLYLVDAPDVVGAVKIPQSVTFLFKIGNFGDFLTWFGYTTPFCQFVCKGWFCCNISIICMIMFLFRAKGPLSLSLMKIFIKRTIRFGGIILFICFIPVAAAAYNLRQAELSFQRGEFEQSRDYLVSAGKIFGVLKYSSVYIVQLGIIDDKLEVQSPYSEHFDALRNEFYSALKMEQDSHFHEAEHMYFKMIQGDYPFELKREAIRGLLRAAINDVNNQHLEKGTLYLETILMHEPVNLKANFSLQLAYIKSHQFQKVPELVFRLRDTYKLFTGVRKKPVLGFASENLMIADYLNEDFEGSLHWKIRMKP